MAGVTLVRRKEQLDLLAEACTTHADATLVLASPVGASVVMPGRLIGWDGVEVLLAASQIIDEQAFLTGGRLTVNFTVRGMRFWFRADVRSIDAGVVHLSRPLRIEPERRRSVQRVVLSCVPPTYGTFVPVEDAQARFVARLVDFSSGGLGTATRNLELLSRRIGELFWTHVPLPGEACDCDFVVRLTYARPPAAGAEGVATGWAFHPGDDGAHFQLNLDRLQRFVERYCRAKAEGLSRSAAAQEGETPWK